MTHQQSVILLLMLLVLLMLLQQLMMMMTKRDDKRLIRIDFSCAGTRVSGVCILFCVCLFVCLFVVFFWFVWAWGREGVVADLLRATRSGVFVARVCVCLCVCVHGWEFQLGLLVCDICCAHIFKLNRMMKCV